MRSEYVELKDGQEIKANKTILFSKNTTPNDDFIDLYNILQRNVDVLERVEKLLEDNR